MNAPAPCEVLEWDSAFFGVKIARAKGHRMDEAILHEVCEWCHRESVKCLYFLGASDDPQTVEWAQQGGFELMEVRVELEWLARPVAGAAGRLATEADISALQALTQGAFLDSRFYADRRFPRNKCDEFYARWIAESCRGKLADAVIVAEEDGRPAGFVTCKREGSAGRIGLVAVDAAHRGKGVGTRAMQAAQAWFVAAGMEKVYVVTQGRNIASQRLYQRCGFLTHSVGLYYHKWF